MVKLKKINKVFMVSVMVMLMYLVYTIISPGDSSTQLNKIKQQDNRPPLQADRLSAESSKQPDIKLPQHENDMPPQQGYEIPFQPDSAKVSGQHDNKLSQHVKDMPPQQGYETSLQQNGKTQEQHASGFLPQASDISLQGDRDVLLKYTSIYSDQNVSDTAQYIVHEESQQPVSGSDEVSQLQADKSSKAHDSNVTDGRVANQIMAQTVANGTDPASGEAANLLQGNGSLSAANVHRSVEAELEEEAHIAIVNINTTSTVGISDNTSITGATLELQETPDLKEGKHIDIDGKTSLPTKDTIEAHIIRESVIVNKHLVTPEITSKDSTKQGKETRGRKANTHDVDSNGESGLVEESPNSGTANSNVEQLSNVTSRYVNITPIVNANNNLANIPDIEDMSVNTAKLPVNAADDIDTKKQDRQVEHDTGTRDSSSKNSSIEQVVVTSDGIATLSGNDLNNDNQSAVDVLGNKDGQETNATFSGDTNDNTRSQITGAITPNETDTPEVNGIPEKELGTKDVVGVTDVSTIAGKPVLIADGDAELVTGGGNTPWLSDADTELLAETDIRDIITDIESAVDMFDDDEPPFNLDNLGKHQSEYEAIFKTFPNYQNSSKILAYQCVIKCGGLGDRLKGIMTVYILSILAKRRFALVMKEPSDIANFLLPNVLNWKLTEEEEENLTPHFYDYKTFHNTIAVNVEWEDIDPLTKFTHDIVYIVANQDWTKTFRRLSVTPYRFPHIYNYTSSDLKRIIYHGLFKPTYQLQELVDRFFTKLNGDKLACLHARMGEEAYVRYTFDQIMFPLNFLKEKFSGANYRVMIATDNNNVKNFSQTFFQNFVDTSYDGPIMHIDYLQNGTRPIDIKEGAFMHSILDHMILTRCDHLVLTNSGFGVSAGALRHTSHGLYVYMVRGNLNAVLPTRRELAREVFQWPCFADGNRASYLCDG